MSGVIVPAFRDTFGQLRPTPRATERALLDAMHLEADEPLAAGNLESLVIADGEPPAAAEGDLELEDGTTLKLDGRLPPDLPYGYHLLHRRGVVGPQWVIRTPGRCPFDASARSWGWAVQLYSLRSRHSWGHGDFSDLRRLGEWSRRQGASTLLINPLHAVAPCRPQQPSPYYPSSRRFLNPLYLDIERVPGADAARDHWEALAAAGRRLNDQRLVDRDAVFRLKMEALQTIWQRSSGRAEAARFTAGRGDSLRQFAVFCVLAEQHGSDWRRWPESYRSPQSPAVARFAGAHRERVEFHIWLQWLLDRQLAEAAASIPLVQDLPIGVDPGGADAWAWRDVLAEGVTIGAPPDQFNSRGQNWCLPPFVPHRLRNGRYRPFIETLQASLRHAGGLRIDHVMGLFRLYWIPAGFSPSQGAYVRYPFRDLLAIVSLESHRAGAWVAGEDLGTVEAEVRKELDQRQMLSYRLLWFETDPPERYPARSLAAVTTHDLPTIAGLWSGRDFAAQQELRLKPDRRGYAGIRRRLQRATGAADNTETPEVIRRAYERLAASPSAVVAASLEDALAVEERPNMPGTIDEWPNWRLALPEPLERLQQAPLAGQIAAALSRRNRPAAPPPG